MKKLIVSVFAAASLMGGFGMTMTTAALAQTACGPNVPEAWTRPGGFCDNSGGTRSLSLPQDAPEPGVVVCDSTPVVFTTLKQGQRVHVAEDCGSPCPSPIALHVDPDTLKALGRVHVAQSGCDSED